MFRHSTRARHQFELLPINSVRLYQFHEYERQLKQNTDSEIGEKQIQNKSKLSMNSIPQRVRVHPIEILIFNVWRC